MVGPLESLGGPLMIAVLEPGDPHGGIRRYAEVVADGLAQLDGAEIREVRRTPTSPGRAALAEAWGLVRQLREADAVLLPYTRFHSWSPGRVRVLQLAIVLLGLRRRTVTVLHDVYPPGWPQRVEWWALAMVTLLAGEVVVHTEQERANLRRLPRGRRARVVPHFVLERDAMPDRAQARADYGVDEGVTVAALVGWLNPRKNYELALDALTLLEPRVVLWLIGGVDEELGFYEAELRQRVRELGVTDRVTFTGSVSEAELEHRLAAIDVGVCPYRRISASGSVSTLLGARRPIVVTDVEFSRELHALAPEVVHTIDTLDAPTLAAAVAELAARAPVPEAFDPILGSRSVAATAARYRALLGAVARSARRHL